MVFSKNSLKHSTTKRIPTQFFSDSSIDSLSLNFPHIFDSVSRCKYFLMLLGGDGQILKIAQN